ncbi:putative Thymus-specific serine protease [Paratrimastix pyriformis]|uniref:Thymus-specific serine protease n=1 Tax=Paratrimastix pyriformis TaxID=342808 RepID=A0ABQ8U7Y3_9EUKA|nr:putative Thymus-specific serine protease [Paratrimastix pyriformis]
MMRFLTAFLCFSVVLGVSRTKQHFQTLLWQEAEGEATNGAAPELWFTQQKLNHFDLSDSRTWSQKYYVNDSFWGGPGSPIFLMLGGEGPVNPNCVGGRFVFADWAQKFKAMAICVEHRFYGKSIPTKDVSTDSLKYLSSDQALADYALFRQFIAQKYNAPASKWIAFGGSYSGSLAAWQRIKYPHLFAGALASSAPVLAKEDYPEYFDVVQKSLGPACASRVQQATAKVDALLDTPAGRRQLEQLFGTCDPISSDQDAQQFAESISDPICGVVQYNLDNNGHKMNIDQMCSLLTAGSDPLQAYANAIQVVNNQTGGSCIDSSYQAMLRQMRDTSPSSEFLSSRSWTYQTCIEFGYFQRTKDGMSPFSTRITLPFFEQICKDVYGAPLIPDTAWINTYYGATHPVATNIVYPNGGVDPWHVLGVLEDISPEQPHYLIQNTAHCADLYAPRDSDDGQLKTFRQQALMLLQKWLAASYPTPWSKFIFEKSVPRRNPRLFLESSSNMDRWSFKERGSFGVFSRNVLPAGCWCRFVDDLEFHVSPRGSTAVQFDPREMLQNWEEIPAEKSEEKEKSGTSSTRGRHPTTAAALRDTLYMMDYVENNSSQIRPDGHYRDFLLLSHIFLLDGSMPRRMKARPDLPLGSSTPWIAPGDPASEPAGGCASGNPNPFVGIPLGIGRHSHQRFLFGAAGSPMSPVAMAMESKPPGAGGSLSPPSPPKGGSASEAQLASLRAAPAEHAATALASAFSEVGLFTGPPALWPLGYAARSQEGPLLLSVASMGPLMGYPEAPVPPPFQWRKLDFFQTSSSLPPALAGHAADLCGSQLLALGGPCVGGVVEDDHNVHIIDMLQERYETRNIGYHGVASPTGYFRATVVTWPAAPAQGRGNAMLVFGGQSPRDRKFSDNLYRIDLEKWTWTLQETTGTRPSPRWSHKALVYKNKMWVYGGSTDEGQSNDLYALDLDTWEWTRVLLMPRLRIPDQAAPGAGFFKAPVLRASPMGPHPGVASMPGGLAGSSMPGMPIAPGMPALAPLAAGTTLPALNLPAIHPHPHPHALPAIPSTPLRPFVATHPQLQQQPQQLQQQPQQQAGGPAQGPLPVLVGPGGLPSLPCSSSPFRNAHSMVLYGHKAIVFGGWNTCDCNDTFEIDLDSCTWAPIDTTGPLPPSRNAHTAVLYGDWMCIFGGHHAGYYLNDVHALNLVSRQWHSIAAQAPPPARCDHVAAIQGPKMLVFGGGQNPPYRFSDAHALDLSGLAAFLPPVSPAPGPAPSMAGHPSRSIAVSSEARHPCCPIILRRRRAPPTLLGADSRGVRLDLGDKQSGMKVVIQRVTGASVTVSGAIVGQIGRGVCCLVGIEENDTAADSEYICRKILTTRLWDDDGVPWRKSVMDILGGVLLVSQAAHDMWARFVALVRGSYGSAPPDRVQSPCTICLDSRSIGLTPVGAALAAKQQHRDNTGVPSPAPSTPGEGDSPASTPPIGAASAPPAAERSNGAMRTAARKAEKRAVQAAQAAQREAREARRPQRPDGATHPTGATGAPPPPGPPEEAPLAQQAEPQPPQAPSSPVGQ